MNGLRGDGGGVGKITAADIDPSGLDLPIGLAMQRILRDPFVVGRLGLVSKCSKINVGVFGKKFICVHAPRRLARRRAGRGRGQQADLKISLRSTPAVMVERLAAGSKFYGARAAQQLRSPTGRPRLVARKPSLRSRRPAIEGPKNNQSCAAAQEPDWATAPRGAKAKPAEQAPGD